MKKRKISSFRTFQPV